MSNINYRLQQMFEKIDNGDIFKTKGIGNDINFYVFDYDPLDEYIVREQLNLYLGRTNQKIRIFNIYDIINQILEDKGFMKQVLN